ncbi:hypothetical protein llap_5943 [Limosa lapponica baueri]|uniref:Uncharacterized protein n=1 Tax=Limosa lapponica baueri TaxID=1758121 RepID=A0A2I0UCP0_LIMLA|nr:hypothetical protein llap_5943 [Limosa lapponica baueri]
MDLPLGLDNQFSQTSPVKCSNKESRLLNSLGVKTQCQSQIEEKKKKERKKRGKRKNALHIFPRNDSI